MKQLQKEYKIGNRKYIYNEDILETSYLKYKNYSDEEFIKDIINILHYAVYVCWVKEISSDDCLSDDGIIHEIVHLAQENTRKYSNIKKIRRKFNKTLAF